jgi:superfamily I DNA and/or RNA helicase
VDEAGQVSLGNLVAMATSARSVVLVGDQMQLAQPIQGAHPRDSGLSGLEYLLEGQPVVPAERGIFLSKTWRMHPDLCSFVSAAVYAGQLQSEAGCATQRLLLEPDAHPALKPAGLSFVPVLHQGCRQKSEEEATRTLEILMSLLAQRVMDRRGRERAMSLDDVLVVAPYNMQVNLLRSRLPDGARVGTVDKFQGQEAEAVIVSMATSGAEDMPRDAAFLLSRNRFNVAISRARCLAVLVASPGLLDIVARSVDEMRLANLFCWAEEYAAQGQCTRWA